MASRFRLQIVDIDTRQIVVGGLEPDFRSGSERDLIERVVACAQRKRVGFGRTEAHCLNAFRDAMIETFMETKQLA